MDISKTQYQINKKFYGAVGIDKELAIVPYTNKEYKKDCRIINGALWLFVAICILGCFLAVFHPTFNIFGA